MTEVESDAVLPGPRDLRPFGLLDQRAWQDRQERTGERCWDYCSVGQVVDPRVTGAAREMALQPRWGEPGRTRSGSGPSGSAHEACTTRPTRLTRSRVSSPYTASLRGMPSPSVGRSVFHVLL